MPVGHQLSRGRQVVHRSVLEHLFGSADEIKHAGFQNEKSAIDPALAGLWLFGNFRDPVTVEFDMAIASWRAHRGHGGQFPVAAMEGQQLIEIDVRNAVPPRQHERGLPEPWRHIFDAAARARLQARLPPPAGPARRRCIMAPDRAGAGIDGHVSAQDTKIVEPAFDEFAFVSECDGEFRMTVARIVAHDMPENRPSADFDHRFWPNLGLFSQACTEATRENTDFHFELPPFSFARSRTVKLGKPTRRYNCAASVNLKINRGCAISELRGAGAQPR